MKLQEKGEKYVFLDIENFPRFIYGDVMTTFVEADTKENKYFNKCIQFVSNSPELMIKCQIQYSEKGNYPHVGISAKEGICVAYSLIEKDGNDNMWHNIDCFSAKDGMISAKIQMTNFVPENVSYRFTIFMPILSRLTKVIVGIERGRWMKEDMSISRDKLLVVIGGVNMYGIGVTSSAFIASNILFHHLKREVYNLSKNSADIYQLELLEIVDKINPQTIILECDCTHADKTLIKKYLPAYLEHLSKYNLIILMNAFSSDQEIEAIVLAYESVSEKVTVVRGKDLFATEKEQEYASYSKNYINDLGQVLIAKRIESIISEKDL